MLTEAVWRLGLGVVLGWAALPLLARLARCSQRAAPAIYHRSLVAALGIATTLVFAPWLRASTGGIPLAMPEQLWTGSRTVTFVADWVTPLLRPDDSTGSFRPLVAVSSGIGVVWLSLFGIGVALSLWGRFELWRAYRGAAAAPAEVLAHARRVAAELGIVTPEIRVAEGLPSAFTFGVISPVVVIGAAACHGREQELDFTLRHELLHVARSDCRTAFWIDLAQRCFTGHPCLRRLAAEIRFAREASVDERAAGELPLEYARFLIVLAERQRSMQAPCPALVSMADSTLERRVKMLMGSTKDKSRAWPGSRWVGLTGLVLGALVFLAPSSWGQGDDAGAGADQHTRVWGDLTVQQVNGSVFGTSNGKRFLYECYAQLSWPRPNFTFRMLFEIGGDGRVSSGRVVVDQHPELVGCLEGVMRDFVFPAPSSGTVSVDFPVLLTPELSERNARLAADEGQGRLPRDVIERVVKEQYPRFRTCYQALPVPRPSLRVDMAFTIARDGKVVDGQVQSKQSPELGKCVDEAMRAMVFPAPEDGIVTVTYPLEFAP